MLASPSCEGNYVDSPVAQLRLGRRSFSPLERRRGDVVQTSRCSPHVLIEGRSIPTPGPTHAPREAYSFSKPQSRLIADERTLVTARDYCQGVNAERANAGCQSVWAGLAAWAYNRSRLPEGGTPQRWSGYLVAQ